MNLVRQIGFFLASVGAAGITYASCDDIAKSCHDAYMLDLAACQRSYSGGQYEACRKRAEQQFNNCYNGTGCK
jgi:hypothetical protein